LLQWGDLRLNPNSCEVTYQAQPLSLASKEYELLELFLRNPEQIFSLDRLLLNLWAQEEMPTEGAVRAHVKGLRQKLKQAGATDLIETIYKLGYRLKQQRVITDQEQQCSQSSAIDLGDPTAIRQKVVLFPAAIPPALRDAWRECRQSYCDRLAIIQQAANALQHGTLTTEERHEAGREAHTLIGSLGSFGLEEASHLSRRIQQLLRQQEPLGNLEIEQLLQLITALRLYLEGSEEEKTRETVKDLQSSSSTPRKTTLLIVDNDLPLAEVLAKEALAWGLQAAIATDLETAQRFLDSGSVDAMLLDLNLSDAASRSAFLTTAHCQYPNIPVVILTAEGTFEQRVEVARLGSQCFLQKPIAPDQVLGTITQVLQQKGQSVARILITDDDPALLQLLSALLYQFLKDQLQIVRPE
jgi:DNA-binding response OmpR family regulator/HPt (histidine-containing phosphotransfer) domain-containing protein